MKRATLISTAAVLAILAGSVGAQAAGRDDVRRGDHGPRFSFEELDANSDGKVTPEEMTAHKAARFAAADTDGDGKLSVEEMAARAESDRAERMKKGLARMIEKRDTDGDGLLSIEEIGPKDGEKSRFMEKLDSDGDGAVSAEEFAKMKDMRGKGHHGKDGKRHGKDRDHGKDRGKPMKDAPAAKPQADTPPASE